MSGVTDFDVLIGQPLSKLLTDGANKGQLDVQLGRINFFIPLTRVVNFLMEHYPEADPMDQARTAKLQEVAQPDLEDDAQYFIQEEVKFDEPLNLDKSEEPPRPQSS